ncbi:hypothetical protein [Sinanaerobacter chloroacetimidivorans]|uniref:Uncharacterized protein n=1 Tax=Sinanaerobacter chloroacetimidivorans TaxID=2818044 RepID=A0A8J7W0J9_9FIRM|nr:hypothetical protein [Sinanaerobacter chloroacetimidivorans]MBR0596971.1 hypothetical protein [Sinanaerobacter chloroacetimidivorans]
MYAQVLKTDMRVNLIGDSDKGLPIEHPAVICVDIGDRTDVKLGMKYDKEKGLFYEEVPEVITPPEAEPATEDYLIDLDFRISKIELGL